MPYSQSKRYFVLFIRFHIRQWPNMYFQRYVDAYSLEVLFPSRNLKYSINNKKKKHLKILFLLQIFYLFFYK